MNLSSLIRVLPLPLLLVVAWPSAGYSQTDPPADKGDATPAATGDFRDGGGATSGTEEIGGVGNEPPRATPGAVADDAYLRGYVDALLENRFAGMRLWVERATTGGEVLLTGDVCLGASQRRQVEQRLSESGLVHTVRWDPMTDCDRPVAGTSPPPREVRALPERELFAPLMADPRQPRFSLSYQRYQAPARESSFDAAAVALGEYFGLAEGFFGDRGSSQVGIEAAVFALFNIDAESNDLVNADYWIALPFSWRRGSWSYQFSLLHQSSHLGDEFILGNPGIDRVNASYEAARFLVSREWERWRLYGGGSYLLHSEPEIKKHALQGGVEYHWPNAWRRFGFVAALDVKSSEELNWKNSYSAMAGLEFRRAGARRMRLMLEYFNGHSPNGQFYRERLNYTGLGFYFGF